MKRRKKKSQSKRVRCVLFQLCKNKKIKNFIIQFVLTKNFKAQFKKYIYIVAKRKREREGEREKKL
jgi:hypothetical protein